MLNSSNMDNTAASDLTFWDDEQLLIRFYANKKGFP